MAVLHALGHDLLMQCAPPPLHLCTEASGMQLAYPALPYWEIGMADKPAILNLAHAHGAHAGVLQVSQRVQVPIRLGGCRAQR